MFEKIVNSSLRRRVKDHVIGREHEFFAVVQPGFESTAAEELSALGINVKKTSVEGGVEFTGKLDSCYTASLMSRTAVRIMMRAGSFRSSNFYELERDIRSFPWELYISEGTGVEYRSTSSKSMIYHTGKLEDIFGSCMAERCAGYGFTLNSGEYVRTQKVFLRNHHDVCTVSIDASGEFLYKRSGRKRIVRAPLRETTAALIFRTAGIDQYELIIDPMCGSGTFSIEAASFYTNTPPGAEREFPFIYWPSFKRPGFNYLKKSFMGNVIPAADITQRIITSDIDPDAVETAGSNIPESFRDIIKPSVADFFDLKPDIAEGKRALIVLNPPYGKRIGTGEEKLLFREIGKKLNHDFRHCGYAVILPGTDYEKISGLEYTRKIPFMNGGIRTALVIRPPVC